MLSRNTIRLGAFSFSVNVNVMAFNIKPHFLKTLFTNRLSILMIFLPTKAELNVVLHCYFSIIL
jgi:hypothetical protein